MAERRTLTLPVSLRQYEKSEGLPVGDYEVISMSDEEGQEVETPDEAKYLIIKSARGGYLPVVRTVDGGWALHVPALDS